MSEGSAFAKDHGSFHFLPLFFPAKDFDKGKSEGESGSYRYNAVRSEELGRKIESIDLDHGCGYVSMISMAIRGKVRRRERTL